MTVSTIAKPQVGPDLQRAEADRPRQPFDPQTSAACPRTSSDVQFSLKIRILYLGVFRWTDPNGGQKGGQTHSQTKRNLDQVRGAKSAQGAAPGVRMTRFAGPLPEPGMHLSMHWALHNLRLGGALVEESRVTLQGSGPLVRRGTDRRASELRLYERLRRIKTASSTRLGLTYARIESLSDVRWSYPHRAFQGAGHTVRKSPTARSACRLASRSPVYGSSSASRSDRRPLGTQSR